MVAWGPILKSAFNIGSVLFALLGLALVFLYFNQEHLVFFPQRLAPDFRFEFGAPFREGNLALPSGQTANYLVFNEETRAHPAKGTILYFHGNAGSLAEWGHGALELARKTGWSVWIMDYPGFGKSPGPLPGNEKPLLALGRAFCAEIGRTHGARPLVLFGRSLGSGISAQLARESGERALILETPYRSIAQLGHELYPFLPTSFARFDLNTEKVLPDLRNLPILILHGTADEVVPYAHGQALSRLNPGVTFVTIPGGRHGDLSEHSEYWPAIENFLATAVER